MNDGVEISGITIDRRGFLTSVTVAFTAAPLAGFCASASSSELMPKRAIYQQQAYISLDGSGETYDKPTGNRSTRDYVNSLGREDFLRRHWYT